VGDQDYYDRFGFKQAGAGRFLLPGPVDQHRVLIRDLSKGADKLSGELSVPKPRG
jgi:predicted N-acetyltransferase YhbS